MKSVFFDMDGVLLDSEIVRLDYLHRYLATKGVGLNADDLRWHVGINDHKIAQELVLRYPLSISAKECETELKEYFGDFYLDAEGLCLFPNLVDFVRTIRKKGVKTGVVSSTKCFGLLSVLNRFGLSSSFDVIISSEFVSSHKPSPEPYLTAAKFIHVSPRDCIVIEDSPLGIKSGKAAGMHVIGFVGGSIPQDVSEANEVANSYAQLLSMIDRVS